MIDYEQTEAMTPDQAAAEATNIQTDELLEEAELTSTQEELKADAQAEEALTASEMEEQSVADEEPTEEPVNNETQTTADEPVDTEEQSTTDEPVDSETFTAEQPVETEADATEAEEKPETIEHPATEEEPVEAKPEETGEQAIAEESTEAEKTESKPVKTAFTLTPPSNLEELYEKMCVKRGRKLIFRPSEAIYEGTFKVEGTDKKNEEGIKVKDILDAEIKQGVKLGYLDKFDGLKASEIKEEYENDVVYEYAEQEFKKTGLIYDGQKIKVYVYDFDGKACHHVGYVDEVAAAELIPYLIDKEKYSFALDGIITGGKAKRVTKDENGKITVTKEKDGNLGLELDVTVLLRKD